MHTYSTHTYTHTRYSRYILVSPVHPMRFRGRTCKLPESPAASIHRTYFATMASRCRILPGNTYALYHPAQATDTIISSSR